MFYIFALLFSPLGCCGLQLYCFGETVSIPFWTDSWTPSSFYDKIEANLERDMHTLCLLDIKVAERTVENMMKNRNIFEPPRFMSVSQAIEQLLKIKENIKKSGKIDEDTLAIGVARIGHNDQKLGEASIKIKFVKFYNVLYDSNSIPVSGKLKDLLTVDMGPPLHSLVIPGKMHEIEQNAIDYLKVE